MSPGQTRGVRAIDTTLAQAPTRRAVSWAAAITALALSLATSPAEAATFVKGPYLQDLATGGITVVWETDSATTGEVAVATLAGETVERVAAPVARLRKVRIAGLRPGQRYRYTVTADGQSSGGEFATAPDFAEPFSFTVLGDSQVFGEPHRTMVERVAAEVPAFVLRTGDLVENGSQEADWQAFFDIERDLMRETVTYSALGNHDRRGDGREVIRRYFSYPPPASDTTSYYAFTYGNTRVIVLDSNTYSFGLADQTAWLERELAAANADPNIAHRFVAMHHPTFSVSLHGGHPEVREVWAPLFERYGVDAVFAGHDHTYQRAVHHDVRYFVSGGGGSSLYPRVPNPRPEDAAAVVYFERTYSYLAVHIAGDAVELVARRDDGSLIEVVSWTTRAEPLLEPLPPHPLPNTGPATAPAPAPPPVLPAVVAPPRRGSDGIGCAVVPADAGALSPAGVLAALAISALWWRRPR